MNNRPQHKDRKFVSPAVESKINEVKSLLKDTEISLLFENCFPNTLDTTIFHKIIDGKPDTFVITGDINAMWLRDSTAQVWPYIPFVKEDDQLKNLIAGVINRQTKCILIDPYANAFNDGPSESPWKDDLTEMKPELHERKWELDSLCYAIRLAYNFWKETKEVSCFDEDWIRAMKLLYKTLVDQQRKETRGQYTFKRITAWQTDTVPGNGYGNPVYPNGLVASIFRPSDDVTIYPFIIPSNYFAAVSLRQLAEILSLFGEEKKFEQECLNLADEIENALNKNAVVEHLNFGKILAYEIDGFGNSLFMDDAGIPSLLSLPYLGCLSKDDEIYKNTRRFVLSKSNPYFFVGKAGEGIGSPHTLVDTIWHLGIIMRALTSEDDSEIKFCLDMIKQTHAGTYFIHESFHKDDANNFTRSWFAWANSLFGELILKLVDERPYLII